MKKLHSPRALRMPAHPQLHSFQQQFSPTSGYLTHSMSDTINSSDPQILLSQRWQRISSELSNRELSRHSVVVLNRSLDEVEHLLSWDAPNTISYQKGQFRLGIAERSMGDVSLVQFEATPPESTNLDAPALLESQPSGLDSSLTETLLLKRITHAVEKLRQRQDEFKQLHNVAIAKAEDDTARIVQLESQVDQLEADTSDDQSELTYLKFKLRILEIQALPYVPRKEKDSLTEGIQRWKLDWADVESRMRTRRRKRDPGKFQSIEICSNSGTINRIL